MKQLILCVALSLIPAWVWAAGDGLNYVDAQQLTLVGKAMPTPANPYHRVDTAKYRDMPGPVKKLYTHPTGLAVCFQTNSTTVAARWETRGKSVANHMTPVAHRGLDLYMYSDGDGWIPVGVGRPAIGQTCSECRMAQNLQPVEHRFLLYLPILEELLSLEVGIDSTATIEAIPSPFRHTVLVYGSSILHGECASRPGLTYPARLSRSTGINFVNYGVSGNGKMETSVADMMKDIEADAFVLDCMPNPSPQEITERTSYLVKTLREHHPGVPIILIESYMREKGYSDRQVYDRCRQQSKAFVEQYELLKEQGVPDLYLIRDRQAIGTDHEGSLDGVHPNDVGFERMARQYEPQLMEILHRYGIE